MAEPDRRRTTVRQPRVAERKPGRSIALVLGGVVVVLLVLAWFLLGGAGETDMEDDATGITGGSVADPGTGGT